MDKQRLLPLPVQFQSTHPVRGATVFSSSFLALMAFQSTHPVRGATAKSSVCANFWVISIHAPREGCDD